MTRMPLLTKSWPSWHVVKQSKKFIQMINFLLLSQNKYSQTIFKSLTAVNSYLTTVWPKNLTVWLGYIWAPMIIKFPLIWQFMILDQILNEQDIAKWKKKGVWRLNFTKCHLWGYWAQKLIIHVYIGLGA